MKMAKYKVYTVAQAEQLILREVILSMKNRKPPAEGTGAFEYNNTAGACDPNPQTTSARKK